MAIHKKQQRLFKGALLLTIAGLIGKILSAGYRVPLQNIAGDIGFYIYQQVYPLLGIAWMISIYGFPMAISSLVARAHAEGRSLSVRHLYAPIFSIMIGVSIVSFTGLYFGASRIASFMGDTQLEMPLKVTATVFLLLPFTSLGRGVFQGVDDMVPTAISQLTEQFLRVGIIIAATIYLVQNGYNSYYVGAGAAFGSLIGGFGAIVILVLFILRRHSQLIKPSEQTLLFKDIFQSVMVTGLFLCINYMMLLCIQLADAITMVDSLTEYGLGLELAKERKGVFDRGYPLIQLGTVLSSSLALALVPSVTKSRFENKKNEVKESAGQAIKLSLLISLGAAAGLFILMPEINVLLFTSNEGTQALRWLSITVIVASLALTTSSLLQGFGYMFGPALSVILGVAVKLALNVWFIPIYGIDGGGIATLGGVLVILIVNTVWFKRKVSISILPMIPWKGILLSLFIMIVSVYAVGFGYKSVEGLHERIDYVGYCIVTIGVGMMSYLISLLKTGVFSSHELDNIPLLNRRKR